MMSYLFAITVQIVTFLYSQQYFLQERFLSDGDKKINVIKLCILLVLSSALLFPKSSEILTV